MFKLLETIYLVNKTKKYNFLHGKNISKDGIFVNFFGFDLTEKHQIKLVFQNRRVNSENDGKHVREND